MSLRPTIQVISDTLRHALAIRIRTSVRKMMRRQRTVRIGIDIRPFYEPLTGIGWYLHHLLHELARHPEVELILLGDARITDDGPRLHASIPDNARLAVFDLRGLPLSRFSRPLTAAAYLLLIETCGIDVFFGANFFLPRLHSAVARRRVIAVHDLTYKRWPQLLQKETLDLLQETMARELALANSVICVSESTRRDLLQFYDVDPSRAITIHSGLQSHRPGDEVPGLPSRYLLFVSTVEPRKNLTVLLDAFQALREKGAYTGSLVVVGKIGWKSESLLPRLREEGVLHLDYLAASQLATVYAGAEIFVFPSLYEGFGFPLLEAMGHGVASIAARSSSLPEVGGDACLYFEPESSTQLAAQIERLSSDEELRQLLIQRGRLRAAHFSWESAANETLRVLLHAAE